MEVTASDIEAFHRLPQNTRNRDKPATTIVRFINRKNVRKLIENRKNEVNFENLGLPQRKKLYFNENLCPYFHSIWVKCRLLKRAGLVKYVWTANGIPKIRRDDNSPQIKVTDENILYDLFPDFNFAY